MKIDLFSRSCGHHDSFACTGGALERILLGDLKAGPSRPISANLIRAVFLAKE